MTRDERMWALAQRRRLWRLERGDVDRLYDHLNATRFKRILPERFGQCQQVRIGVSRCRIRYEAGGEQRELLGSWRPASLRVAAVRPGRNGPRARAAALRVPGPGEGRRGWGRIDLNGGATGRTLLHEMIHQALDTMDLPNGHGSYFQRVAADVGYAVTEDDLAAAAEELVATSSACWRRL